MAKKKPKLRFTTYDDWMNDEIHCPVCGTENTHMTDVEVYARHEDMKGCRTIHACGYSGNLSTRTTDNSKNPSARRHAFVLKGHCENGCYFDISFAQHKGRTEVNTELTKPKNLSTNQYEYIKGIREWEEKTRH